MHCLSDNSSVPPNSWLFLPYAGDRWHSDPSPPLLMTLPNTLTSASFFSHIFFPSSPRFSQPWRMAAGIRSSPQLVESTGQTSIKTKQPVDHHLGFMVWACWIGDWILLSGWALQCDWSIIPYIIHHYKYSYRGALLPSVVLPLAEVSTVACHSRILSTYLHIPHRILQVQY